jgi:hypothetical protein
MTPRRTRSARTSRSRPARRARLLTRRSKLRAAARPRRGVLLLVVLSLLVLFLMVGMAFIVTAKQSEKAAKSSMRASVRLASEAAQSDLLDEVLLQIIRDTNNPHSSLRFHSLLADMYGNDGIKTRVTAGGAMWASPDMTGSNVTMGQMVDLLLDTTSVQNLQGIEIDGFGNYYVPPAGSNPPPPRFSPIDNAYSGQVLTFLSGPAKGRSTRIVGFVPPNRFRVMNFHLADGTLVSNPTTQLSESRILINGRPFAGSGFGYNRAAAADAPKLSVTEDVGGTPIPVALLPNAKFFDPSRVPTAGGSADPTFVLNNAALGAISTLTGAAQTQEALRLAALIGPAGLGGANEGYDVADFQNMALSYAPATQLAETLVPNPVTAPLPTALTDPAVGSLVIPSWHRPDLINYFGIQLISGGGTLLDSGLATNAMLLRKVLLRPNWIDHPNFTGSNPEFASITGSTAAAMGQRLARMVYGPWDVDNDNDGVRDSIWVDVGLPVMAGPNGKLVKPLVAMHIVDMDGRANVNAAGSCDLAEAWGGSTSLSGVGAGSTLASGIASTQAPRGVGYGPADVSLAQVVGPNDFRRLLIGDSSGPQLIPGRYGFPDGGLVRPGASGVVDVLSQVQFFGWPRNASVRSSFGTPSDLRARYGLGVNSHGQPVFDATLTSEITSAGDSNSLLIDSPYELNLSKKVAAGLQGYGAAGAMTPDAIFSEAELERVLRMYDPDAGSLPARLMALAGVPGDPAVRNKITTTSFDLPVPAISLPHELAEDPQMWSTNPQFRRLPKTAAEIIEMRVRKALGLAPFPETIIDPSEMLQLREALRQIVAPELASGGRLNINRPLGNGRDDNGNGVVDEPGEDSATAAHIWDTTAAPAARTAGFIANFPGMAPAFEVTDSSDPRNPVYDSAQPVDHRQLMARHLYVTALAMGAEADYDGTRDADKELARRIAQWAINVVDFRDADNIMTPFEYDLNPFNGWQVDGAIGKSGPDGLIGTDDDTTADSADDAANHRGLVWGAERPELLITETIAWHDRNTTDEADEDPNDGEQPATIDDPTTPDQDFDQLYRPRGAFFMEIYNPWPAAVSPSRDIHDSAAQNGVEYSTGVNLAAETPTVGASPASPVWRVLVTRDVDPTKDPDDPANRPEEIDRSIYFTENAPDLPDDGESFYKHPEDPDVRSVRPGRYMVIGSGTRDENDQNLYVSQFGQRLDQTPSERPRKPLRRIELDMDPVEPHPVRLIDNLAGPGSVALNRQGGGTGYPMQAPSESEAGAAVPQLPVNDRRSVTDVAVINGHGGQRRRFTLSEPAEGYPLRVGNVQFVSFPLANGTSFDPSEDGQYCFGGDEARPKAIDTPLDDVDGDGELSELGTNFERGRRLFLQRLANPLVPYDAVANPYLTVDDTQAYITVFNGRLSGSQTELGKRNSEIRGGFSSVERGYGARGLQADRDLWKTRAPDSRRFAEQDPTRQAINPDTIFSMARIPQVTLGFLNRPFLNQAENDVNRKRVLPEQPFPWLNWNNRPFISGNELLMVPRHRSSQMLRYFRSAEKTTPPQPYEPYEPGDPDDPRQQFANPNFQPKPFSHLESFFATEAGGAAQDGVPLHLYRMLELIETPSLFAGTETWLNPTNFNSSASASISTPNDPRAQYLAPFNRVSEFRDPGLINVNTVSERDSRTADRNVWDAMFHGRANRQGTQNRVHPGPSLEEWVSSRRGYGANGDPATLLNAQFPTVFGNPLRPADAGDWVPLPNMVRAGVDATLLRSDDGTAGASAAPAGDPLFSTELLNPENDYRNSERNGFFRFQPLVRLDNLVTSRSNVYAVWVTIGFFEVEEAPDYSTTFLTNHGGVPDSPEMRALYNRVYPEGYAFAREDGVDVGNVRRLRGFYIIDRTQMAGFEPGADHNVGNVIRLRRRIE